MKKKMLIVVTNYSGVGVEGAEIVDTGVYLEEFAVPFLIFEKSDVDMTTASLKGGLSPVDEGSMSCSNPDEWDKCIKILRNTKNLYDINLDEFDGIYFPGGHGPLFDIAQNKKIKETVEYFYSKGKLISAICHGVCALLGAKDEFGDFILKGRNITSFTNEEERIIKLNDIVPFSIEDEAKKEGANYIAQKAWSEHVEVSRNIITGQNQNSATLTAEKILEYFNYGS